MSVVLSLSVRQTDRQAGRSREKRDAFDYSVNFDRIVIMIESSSEKAQH